MSASTWWCPAGDGPLVESLTNGTHQTCDACHGFAVTIWLLGEMLVEGGGGRSGGPPEQPRRRVTAARRVAVRCRRPPPPPVTPPATPPPTPPSTAPAMQHPQAARRRREATGGPKTLGTPETLGTLVPSRCVAAVSSCGYRLSRSPSYPSCPHSRSVRVFAHWTRRIATSAERRAPPPTSAAGTAAPR